MITVSIQKKVLAFSLVFAMAAGCCYLTTAAFASGDEKEHAGHRAEEVSKPVTAPHDNHADHKEGEAASDEKEHSEDGHDEHGHGDEKTKGEKKEHSEEGHKDEHGSHEEEGLKIDPKAAADMKIEVVEAGPATIRVSIPVTGKIILNKNTIAQVRARFEGVVKSVSRTQGEMVKAGETLATVESNESLQEYAVKSPIGGMVLERNTNVGHVTGDESLFEVADLSSLWVQFHVFPKDMAQVSEGQKLRVAAVGSSLAVETALASILPVADSASQTVIARGSIDNTEGKWRPGMSVHGEIFVKEQEAAVVIKLTAVQRLEGRTVVFVQEGDAYEARTVRLGLQDGESAEVLEGLKAGERYVSTNSFVLKAHAGKSEAEHVH